MADLDSKSCNASMRQSEGSDAVSVEKSKEDHGKHE